MAFADTKLAYRKVGFLQGLMGTDYIKLMYFYLLLLFSMAGYVSTKLIDGSMNRILHLSLFDRNTAHKV